MTLRSNCATHFADSNNPVARGRYNTIPPAPEVGDQLIIISRRLNFFSSAPPGTHPLFQKEVTNPRADHVMGMALILSEK